MSHEEFRLQVYAVLQELELVYADDPALVGSAISTMRRLCDEYEARRAQIVPRQRSGT